MLCSTSVDKKEILKMLTSYEKIFVIGSNKTGTTSFHNLFLRYGLKSQHGLTWELNDYQCFSDGVYNSSTNNIYKNCYATFPNSLFILNTRPLYNWLYSRANHCCILKSSKMEGWPPNNKTYLSWIEWRMEYYNDILNYFADKKDKLIICNIEKPFWENFIMSFISNKDIQTQETYLHNKTLMKKIENLELNLIKSEVEKTFSLTDIDKYNLFPNNLNIDLYKSHI
jgi:hypothetical protein